MHVLRRRKSSVTNLGKDRQNRTQNRAKRSITTAGQRKKKKPTDACTKTKIKENIN